MKFDIAAKSDAGKIRSLNEDCIAFDKKSQLVVVCDGMGGHQSGEVASNLAGKMIVALFATLTKADILKIVDDISGDLPAQAVVLIAAIRLANRKLFQLSLEHENFRGMGTTVAALLFTDNFFVTANVGDSRIYRYGNDKLEQITEDHTLLNELISDGEISPEQAKKIQRANVITRALGLEPSVKIDIRIEPLCKENLFLLCTDGLTGALSDEDILRIINFNHTNLSHLVQHLVDDAVMRDGSDNISVAAVNLEKIGEAVSNEIYQKITISAESKSILKKEDKIWRQLNKNSKINEIYRSIK